MRGLAASRPLQALIRRVKGKNRRLHAARFFPCRTGRVILTLVRRRNGNRLADAGRLLLIVAFAGLQEGDEIVELL